MTYGEMSDEFALWVGGTHLRGANIWQRRVYPDIDYGVLGPGPIGPPFTQDDLMRMAGLGANYVNISHPGLFTEEPPFTLDESVRDNLDHLLEMIAEADMFAVISFRTGPGRSEFTFYFGDDGDWFDASMYNDTVWEDPAAQDAWVEMWRYTAEYYRDNPIVVGYDLMVEPNSNEVMVDIWDQDQFYSLYGGTLYDWNQLYPRIIEAIREVDPETPILVGGMGYSGLEWLPYMRVVDDPRVVYTFHQYEPIRYTHQMPGDDITYPGTLDLDWDGEPEVFDRQWLDGFLYIARNFSALHGVPVAANEFGVVRWAPNAPDFMRDEMELFEEMGINYAFWEFAPAWEPMQDNDAFDFLHGPDPDNHENVDNELAQVVMEFWGRNTIRPSNFGRR